VIAGNGENRTIVLAVRFVELVVVILAFAEVVDDIAQVKKEPLTPPDCTSPVIASATAACSASEVAPD
jgi:hypothetical protein